MPTGRVLINKWTRKLHRWGALAVVLPFALVLATGLLLQVKKQWAWVQPPTMRSDEPAVSVDLDALLDAARSVPEAGIETWADVDRIDVRPGRGIAKVRATSRWEVQVDTHTGAVLAAAYRRSDLIESLHDGSFFGDGVKLGVFLPAGLVVAGLTATGVWLWWMPHGARRRRLRANRSS
jgi:uncharacterized iron-regulated membrane protein